MGNRESPEYRAWEALFLSVSAGDVDTAFQVVVLLDKYPRAKQHHIGFYVVCCKVIRAYERRTRIKLFFKGVLDRCRLP